MTNFAGLWITTFGRMELTQQGAQVQGSYTAQGRTGTLEGRVEGGKLVFRYEEPSEWGEGWFALEGYGRFSGRYRPEGHDRWFDWEGTREWEGVWETSFGRLRLIQEADRIHGFYEGTGPSTIEGHLEDGRLVFRYQEPGVGGEGVFELSEDALSFLGQWRPDGAEGWGQWLGRRIRPQPGVTWVMVLEAHWQHSLADLEYSFGGMVKEFLSRLAGVAVRQRIFNDEASLEHWCRELLYFPEPAIVMIASHGSPEGLSVHGRSINTRLVIDCLRPACNIRLLHFSSCLVLQEDQAGDFVRRIERAAPFPISGYTTSVDWGGSAILEFTYLDLLLAKGLSPAEAADLLPRLLSFAGDADAADSPYGAAGFRFFPRAGE